ncbi:peptidase family M13-domain-containing protein [Suillus tomentosus]|nr:peptidase family M13-domain-containing protein [Suillus tomentosus]
MNVIFAMSASAISTVTSGRIVVAFLDLKISSCAEEISSRHVPLTTMEDSEHVWPPCHGHLGMKKNARELAQKVVQFDTEIADATLDLDKLQQDPFGMYNPTNINTLKAELSQINFPDYFSTFTPRTCVVITYKPYPNSLSEILKKTPADVIEAYLVVRASLEYAPNLGWTTEAWKAVRTLQETLYGLKPGVFGEHSQFCMTRVDVALGFGTGRYFVNQTFPGESREKAT